ncbi:MAG: hypothetical protein JJT81_06200 [Rubellimicrobium sp.]|nr:hypothetical protein [Rubellimicrobium sp.]
MPTNDPFASHARTLTDPVAGGFAISPSDTTDLAVMPRAIMVAGGGNVAAVMQDGMTLTLPALGPGMIHPFRIRRVLATGTTATGILGLY